MNRFILVLALVFLIVPTLSFASPIDHHPCYHITHGTSSNWAGYSVQTSNLNPQDGAVTDVKGSWIVPNLSCSSTPDSYSSMWVGIDGYTSRTVEQTGTESDCSSGSPINYAWYEMYPAYPVNLDMSISPGDLICAEVKYLGNNQFQLILKNANTGENFSTVQVSTRARRSSAEWVAEAPDSTNGILPLANLGTAYFENAQATINGVSGAINNPAWQFDIITMTSPTGILKATTSPFSSDGSGFYVRWIHQ